MGQVKRLLESILDDYQHCINHRWHMPTIFRYMQNRYPSHAFRLIGNELTCDGVSLTNHNREFP